MEVMMIITVSICDLSQFHLEAPETLKEYKTLFYLIAPRSKIFRTKYFHQMEPHSREMKDRVRDFSREYHRSSLSSSVHNGDAIRNSSAFKMHGRS